MGSLGSLLKVKSNQGAAGLDGQTIEEFERDLKKNLYRIWNRMTSGSYFPAASADGEDPESQRRRKDVGDSDGGFIMHLPLDALRIRCGFGLSYVPSLVASDGQFH